MQKNIILPIWGQKRLFFFRCNVDKIRKFLILKCNDLYGNGKDTSGIYYFFKITQFWRNEREMVSIYIEKRSWKDFNCKIVSLVLL